MDMHGQECLDTRYVQSLSTPFLHISEFIPKLSALYIAPPFLVVL